MANDSQSVPGRKPGLLVSLLPVILLVVAVSVCVRLFKDDVTAGPSQLALLFSGLTASLIGILRYGIKWKEIEDSITGLISGTSGAIFILLMIGALTGSWMVSGVVPSLIYYGLKIIHPAVFLPLIYLMSSVISFMVGSSWTTVGTFGVAMLAAGQIMGFPAHWLAGAIISGAYFGDMTSFLSDTTNLASSTCSVPLFTHVKYMLVNTVPVYVVAFIIFAVAGFCLPVTRTLDLQAQMAALTGTFHISIWLLLVPVVTLVLIFKKVSPFITLFLSSILAGIVALLVQPDICRDIVGGNLHPGWWQVKSFFRILTTRVTIETGNPLLNDLTSTSGMAGMLNTAWLIICVACFGGAMTATGMIARVTQSLLRLIRGTFSLVATTLGTSIFMNLTLSDQYMAILLPGRMFADTYKKKGYAPELLSRTLEESGTVTSVLVPWNTCAVVQSSVLGVATLTYLPYCFFNILTVLWSLFAAAIGYGIRRIRD